ncbi:MAG: DegQ family serine endoprotease [Aestuariivirga sp.]|uniref:DegQ family serine endoprotease n=1 Tax=Aestuariivirga sp. TaxID=2650926 RepID=UPI0025BB3F92|nr:DegQ family serine endoprotease [Aestuariivirga sp.]MCA3560731.1 DegQ family serine endoprotease [Aestuariivirga sp.]
MRFVPVIASALMLVLGGPLAQAASKAVPASAAAVQLSFAPVVKTTAPAVVNVYSQRKLVEDQGGNGFMQDPFFRRFFGDGGSFGRPRERVANSLGSGVIVDPNGLIVTNNHVIANATDIKVALADKREFEAKVLIADERTDLAVLKIEVPDELLPALALADSDALEVGDLVLAIGNPFGVGQTVTSGIISALARTRVGVSDYQFFIQTDAAINPGNSGGALVNMRGELVGINTAIFSRSGGSIGIGFAIPTNMVKTVVATAENGGVAIKRPWLGAELQDVSPDIATSLGMARPEGALIVSLHPDSPLAKAGLKRGDIVLALEGKPVETAQELGYRAATASIGATIIVEYRRKGDRKETQVTMIAAPETVKRDDTAIGGANPFTGATVANLSPAVADELGLPADAEGVVVTKIDTAPALRFFKRGDIVLEVNGAKIDSVGALNAALADDSNLWRIAINRGGRVVKMAIGG